MAPVIAISPEDEMEPTEYITFELERAPARVVEPDTFRYPDVSRPVVL